MVLLYRISAKVLSRMILRWRRLSYSVLTPGIEFSNIVIVMTASFVRTKIHFIKYRVHLLINTGQKSKTLKITSETKYAGIYI